MKHLNTALIALCWFSAVGCGGGNVQSANTSGNAAEATAGTAATTSEPQGLNPTSTAAAPDGTTTKLVPLPAKTADAGKGAGEPGRTTDDIANAVKAKRDQARACYDQAEAKHRGIEGNVVIAFVIDPKGVVKDVKVDPARSNLPDDNVAPCIIPIIQALTFPASSSGKETRAAYPYNFRPKMAPSVVPSAKP
jgi:TonB family protein